MPALAPPTTPALRALRTVLDVRDEARFRAGHLPGSGHLPAAELAARRNELPPRDAPLLVVADDAAAAAEAARELERLGYADVAWLDGALGGCGEPLAPGDEAVPLWRPAPFLASVIDRLPRGRALDVAAGSGREAVFLAMNGFEVEAWDRAPEALARASALAERHRTRITPVVYDFERRRSALPEARYDLVVCFRFLQRSLFPAIAAALRPGGHLVYETYRVGQERHGRPTHPRFLLQPGELRAAFPGFEVLHDEELEPAHGPVTARLWARRPPAGPAGA